MKSLLRIVILAAIAWFGNGVTPVMAASVTYSFVGTVTRVDPQLTSGFTNTAMTGTIKVDMTDGNPSPGGGFYRLQSFTSTIGGYVVTGMSAGGGFINGVTFLQDGVDPVRDEFHSLVVPVDPQVQVNGFIPTSFEINLVGPSSIFNSDALPNPAPSIASFTNVNRFTLIFTGDGTPGISGHLTSLTAVPLPASVVLFGVGIVVLFGLGGCRLRNRLPQV